MKRVNLLPNIITAFGLACGLFIIFRLALSAHSPVSFDLIQASFLLLLVAAIADVCDGAVARLLKAESEFGVQFDSLSDGITFGVAPIVIVLKSVVFGPESEMFFLLTGGAIVFSLCGVLRLARYNVRAMQLKVDSSVSEKYKKYFVGLPIPAAALAISSLNLLLMSDEVSWMASFSGKVRGLILACVMVLIGYLMISRWFFASIKTFNVRVESIYLVFLTAIIGVFVLYGIFHHLPLVMFLLIWGYILIAWGFAVGIAIKKKKLDKSAKHPFDNSLDH